MVTHLETRVRRLLQRFRNTIERHRLADTVSAALTGRSHVERISGVLDELNIALVAVDATSNTAVVNSAAAAMLNIGAGKSTASEFTAVLKSLAAHALNQDEVAALMGTLDGQSTAAFTSTWVFADSPTYLGVASKPATYPGFEGRIWAFYDNSHVARAVEAELQAASLIRASTDAMIDPQVILEGVWHDGEVVDLIHRDINEAGCAYFGMSREQFIGRSLIDKDLMEIYSRCAETGEPVILDASPYRRDDAEAQRFYDIRGTQVRPGTVVITWRDVTERIEAAERIAASQEQFRLLAENIGDVVVRLTDEGVITWVSDSVEPALGAPADYWVNRHFVDFGVPGRRPDARRRWAEMVAGKSFIGRRQVRGADGAVHWIHLHSEPFHAADGTRDGLVASFRVIDDEVAVEDRAREQIARQDERNRRLAGYLKAQTTRLMTELNSAASYVASILPDDLEGRVTVRARYLPSEELGGDTYDFRWLDDDHLMVYLVDVSGHGVGPALLSVSVHNLLRSGSLDLETQMQPERVLTELNRLFQMDRHGGNYFTIWYGVFEASSRTLRYASAGHPPALVLAGESAPEQLSTDSMPVGMLADTEFAERSYTVPTGAELLLYSDGALELGLPEGEQRPLEEFGNLYACSVGKTDSILNTLIVKLEENAAPAKVTDDSTFVHLSIP